MGINSSAAGMRAQQWPNQISIVENTNTVTFIAGSIQLLSQMSTEANLEPIEQSHPSSFVSFFRELNSNASKFAFRSRWSEEKGFSTMQFVGLFFAFLFRR